MPFPKEDQMNHPFFAALRGYPRPTPKAEAPAPQPDPSPQSRPVLFKSTPTGATVTYAGVEYKTPCTIEIELMTAAIPVSKSGYQTTTRVVEPSEKAVDVKLVKVA